MDRQLSPWQKGVLPHQMWVVICCAIKSDGNFILPWQSQLKAVVNGPWNLADWLQGRAYIQIDLTYSMFSWQTINGPGWWKEDLNMSQGVVSGGVRQTNVTDKVLCCQDLLNLYQIWPKFLLYGSSHYDNRSNTTTLAGVVPFPRSCHMHTHWFGAEHYSVSFNALPSLSIMAAYT